MALTFTALALLMPALAACGSATASSDVSPAQGEPLQGEALKASRAPQAAAKTGTIRVVVKGFRNRKGQALVSLFANSKGFPGNGDTAARRSADKVDSDQIQVVFNRVPVGSYAVAVLHDEDMNFKMKTGLFGIPKEGYGVSNNARERFGPPKFGDARFKVTGMRDVELTISLIYH